MSFSFNRMKIRNKLLLITAVAFFGVTVLSVLSLISLKDRMLEEKRLKTQHLVETVHGMVDQYYKLSQSGKISADEAKLAAMTTVKGLRYDNAAEYFWINDLHPKMIMHPIRPELDGKDLSDMKDPHGKYLFVEFAKTVKNNKAGFVDYMWPKPGFQAPVPKISYVKGFEPWGWVIGSGIYIDDVNAAFWQKARVFAAIAFVIIAMIMAIAVFVTRSILGQLGAEPYQVTEITRKVAGGDLSFDIESGGQKGSLLAAEREMVERLREIVNDIKVASESLASGSEQLSASSEEISRGMTEQSERASQIASSTEEMSQAVLDIARNASNMASSATTTTALAHKGEDIVKKSIAEVSTIDGKVTDASGIMKTLGERSSQIGEIVNVIEDIADQTNLLALNAAIEAARAGDQGRGFAVVAGEVKKLAERTANATSEIAAMIKSIQKDVDVAIGSMSGVKVQVEAEVGFSTQAGQSLHTIVESVGQLHLMVQQIATATEEMSSVSENISSDIQSIAQSSKETTVGSDHIASASLELAGLAAKLKEVISRFKV
jgi:methyl-accepting chemotaxis protein